MKNRLRLAAHELPQQAPGLVGGALADEKFIDRTDELKAVYKTLAIPALT